MAPELTRAHILFSRPASSSKATSSTGGTRTREWVLDPLFGNDHGVVALCRSPLLSKSRADAGILDRRSPVPEGCAAERFRGGTRVCPVHLGPKRALWETLPARVGSGLASGAQELPYLERATGTDGMKRVGIEGRGESIWLAWFLCDVLHSFARMAERPRIGRDNWRWVSAWSEKAAHLAARLDAPVWDGEWYLRGFFDNGTPLGSHERSGRRGSIPCPSPGRGFRELATHAHPAGMDSAQRLLVDEKDRIVLAVHASRSIIPKPHPAIHGLPPAVRENGGQYTHGSLLAGDGLGRLGEGAEAVRLLKLMNRGEWRAILRPWSYRGEPYVVAADVSSAPGRAGQSG